MGIVKFRSVEPENAAHLPSLDNGIEVRQLLLLAFYFSSDIKCRMAVTG